MTLFFAIMNLFTGGWLISLGIGAILDRADVRTEPLLYGSFGLIALAGTITALSGWWLIKP